MRLPVSLLAALLLLVSACTAAPTQPGGQTGDQPVKGGRLVRASASDVQSLQPLISFDPGSLNAWRNFYRPLVDVNPQTGELEGAIASEFSMAADRLTFTFRLRDGVVWSDGTPVSAEDYRYTVEAGVRSKKGYIDFSEIVGAVEYKAGQADNISGITVSADGKTITVKRKLALCTGLRVIGLAPIGILPSHLFKAGWNNKTMDATTNIDDHPMNQAPPASVGPFIFKSKTPAVELVMTRNDRFWQGAPLLDEVVTKIYANTAAIKAALIIGEIDYAGAVATDVEEIKASGTPFDLHQFPRITDNNFIGWNQKSAKAPWLANKQVRQALWYAINIPAIINTVHGGLATQTYTHTHPTQFGYPDNGVGLNKYEYSVTKSKQLLEQAGAKMGANGIYNWTDGKPMIMGIDGASTSAPLAQTLEIMQEQYKAVGIQMNPNLLPFPTILQRTNKGFTDREGSFWGWSPGGPEGEPVWPFYHSAGPVNNWFYSNPEADRLIDAGRAGPDCSPAARKTAYTRFNQILNEDAANMYLYSPDTLIFSNQRLRGFAPTANGTDYNIHEWWIKR